MKIALGLPLDADHKPEFWLATYNLIPRLQERYKAEILPIIMYGDGIARARNNIVHDFLKSGFSHLLFIDSDIIFNHEMVFRLFDYSSFNPNCVVAGQYPLKKPELVYCWNIDKSKAPNIDDHGFLQVNEVGTGMMLINRQVLDTLIDKVPSYICDQYKDKRHEFFNMGVYENRWISEDFWFCKVCRDHDIDIRVDTTTVFNHKGSIVFPIKDEQIVKAIVSRCFTQAHIDEYLTAIQKAYDDKLKR